MPKSLRERREERRTQEAASDLPFDQSKAAQLLGIGECWAIEDRYAETALANLERLPVSECIRFAAEERQRERQEAVNAAERKARGEPDPKPYPMSGDTAILQVRGTMIKNRSSWGGASTKALSAQLIAASEDPDVGRVLMIFDTPGGECQGCAEFADVIRAVGAIKPVVAYLEDCCASAGYFAASQCSAIYMNRMGFAGCIGTLMILADYSQVFAMEGIKVYKFTSEGAETYKGAGAFGTEVTEAHKKHFQSLVDHYGADFRATVQVGRGLSDEQITSAAIGKMFTADEAMALGLIDGVCSLADCLSHISGATAPTSPTAADTAPDPAKASRASGQGTPMTLKEIVGRFFGSDPEALSKAGVTQEQLNAALAGDDGGMESRLASLEAEKTRMANAALAARAERFWDMLISPDKDGNALAYHSQRDGVLATFKTLARVDGLKFSDDGEMVIGSALESYMASMLGAIPNAMQKEQLEGRVPTAVKGTAASAEDAEAVLSGTFLKTQAEELAKEVI